MVGASRKGIIGKILGDKPVDQRLTGTMAFHYDNLTKGAKILRVHDVKPAFESILVYNAIKNQAL
jgi:dihydropteroate synthase